jgi:hypothetical protein
VHATSQSRPVSTGNPYLHNVSSQTSRTPEEDLTKHSHHARQPEIKTSPTETPGRRSCRSHRSRRGHRFQEDKALEITSGFSTTPYPVHPITHSLFLLSFLPRISCLHSHGVTGMATHLRGQLSRLMQRTSHAGRRKERYSRWLSWEEGGRRYIASVGETLSITQSTMKLIEATSSYPASG